MEVGKIEELATPRERAQMAFPLGLVAMAFIVAGLFLWLFVILMGDGVR
jgi:uncharacterized integral membrane protein